MKSIRINFLSLVILSFFVLGCYEEQEGCLDSNAINFDVSADINANCQYPKLTIDMLHRIGEERITYDSLFVDVNRTPFRIRFFGFFMRRMQVQSDGELFPVSNHTNRLRTVEGDLIEYPEDILFIELFNSQNVIDSLNMFNDFESTIFTVGLGELSNADSSQIGGNHILNTRVEMLDSSKLFYHDLVIALQTDTSTNDLEWMYHHLDSTFTIEIQGNNQFQAAENNRIQFRLNYLPIFDELNLENWQQEVRERFRTRIESSIEADF